MIRSYFQMLLDEGHVEETAGKMKQFATWFTHGVVGGAALRRGIYECKTGAKVLEVVDKFFAEHAGADGEDARVAQQFEAGDPYPFRDQAALSCSD